MSEQNYESIIAAITELKGEVRQDTASINGQLKIIDKRLSLIEQRLSNIEQWLPVDHKELHFQH